MFNLVSALTTPTVLLKPLSPVQTPATAGAPQGGQTGSRVRDNFAMAVGTGHAADLGALATATGNAREGASLLPDYREIHGRNGSLPLPGHHRPTDIENRPLSPVY